jgi:hypothetical protein
MPPPAIRRKIANTYRYFFKKRYDEEEIEEAEEVLRHEEKYVADMCATGAIHIAHGKRKHPTPNPRAPSAHLPLRVGCRGFGQRHCAARPGAPAAAHRQRRPPLARR